MIKSKLNNIKQPTLSQIYKIAGNKRGLLQNLVTFIHETYLVSEEYRYSQKSGWTILYRKSGKSLALVNIKEGGFVATVVIGKSLNEEVEKSKVSSRVKKIFQDAHQYPDGRWLNIDVNTEVDIEDIKALLLIKRKSVKKADG